MIIQKKQSGSKKKGFTLIELLVVIGIIGILAAVVLVAVNPAHQFALARDTQRLSNVTAILNAVGENVSEHKGILTCNGTLSEIPHGTSTMRSDITVDSFDIAKCLVPTYLASMPFDPTKGGKFTSLTDYDTKYYISQDTNGRVTVSADSEIDVTKPILVTR